ncbi:TonB-dependent receptor domain-containing protein [Sphingomonas hankookensis]|uniref:TonB-dependent receptor domain-containing protein n=1 Tax=Sphingomonas hankookensis TaxID=563996 RepID=UPI003D3017F7
MKDWGHVKQDHRPQFNLSDVPRYHHFRASGGPFNASQGNPGLLPYASDNLDFSLEWYYRPGSYVSVGAFQKWVSNFIGAVRLTGPITNAAGNAITDPSVNPRPGCPENGSAPNPACVSQPGDPVVTFDISSTGNLRDASVRGLEAAVQQVFGDTGFGVILNGTLVDGNISYNVYDVSGSTFALTGLSNSANAVVFYEKNGLQARVSYNWRDKFLLGFAGAGEPVFTEAYGQFDVSASYDVTDNLTVFAERLNITNESTRRHGRFKERLIDYETYGARYSLGVRAKF